MKKLNTLLLVLGSFITTPSFADDSQALQDQLTSLKSFKAEFSREKVTDKQGQAVNARRGHNCPATTYQVIRWQQKNHSRRYIICTQMGIKHITFDSFCRASNYYAN